MHPDNAEVKRENNSEDVIITKFDGVDYLNTFAKSISTMHELIKGILSEQIYDEDSTNLLIFGSFKSLSQ